MVASHIRAAGTSQPCHPALFGADIDAEIRSDRLTITGTRHRALARQYVAANERLSECATAWIAACATVGEWQHVFHLVESRVFLDVQRTVCHDQPGGQ
jgi:hypothetical protein